MSGYAQRRGELETYFDRTAAAAWARLTSDAPVSGIRASVRAGRERMRATLLGWLPQDLRGCRVLDAGCGTGAASFQLAQRGAHVVAIDLSATLVGLAQERGAGRQGAGAVEFRVGDMLDPALGRFDYVLAMDSLIHYQAPDIIRVLSGLVSRTERSVVFTFAPRTPALAAMHAVGRLFPRSDRAPAIEPVAPARLHRLLGQLQPWQAGRTERVSGGFYTSQAMELMR